MAAKTVFSLALFAGIVLLLTGLFAAPWQPAGVQAASPAQQPDSTLWRDIDESAIQLQGERLIVPSHYRTLAVDPAALQARLAQAPREGQPEASAAPLILTLPLPTGGWGRFRVWESPIMAPQLGTRHPDIRTYLAQGLDDPAASGRLDWTPAGFHAIILGREATLYIDPYSRGDIGHYISYLVRDFVPARMPQPLEPQPQPLLPPGTTIAPRPDRSTPAAGSGDELRTYRLAVAATGEYTHFHGGTVAAGLAAIVTAVNRITAIYERDVAVRLELVANNDLLVYTDPSTDPYDNSDLYAMLGQNQTNLDLVIGSANYDIGHVFGTAGGGLAYLGVACWPGYKAQGGTGHPSPVGDPFYVDYVSHEMGHQFGANHTFNGNAGSCAGNGYPPTAYEPGSGSTIMSYSGLCSPQNIQYYADDYFHGASLDEIVSYTTMGMGNSCPVITSTGNSLPDVHAGSSGLTIPILTPFTLTGTASDADGDALTYCWEEFDLGPAGHPDLPVGTAPLFRSFSPADGPARTFPRLSDIVNNTHTIGEILPATSRSLTFRLTARDNRAGGGGVKADTLTMSATDAAGPFLVTQPNTALTWPAGAWGYVLWDAAHTDEPPVNCTTVNIDLSTDGGYTYPLTLTVRTPNDGLGPIPIPDLETTSARVRVSCADNVFFDISNADLAIAAGANRADLALSQAAFPGVPQAGDPLTYTLTVSNNGPDMATGLTLVDTLPPEVTFEAATPGCTMAAGRVRCSLPSLAVDAGHTFTVAVSLGTAAGPILTNQAEIAAETGDPDPANNTAILTHTLSISADLQMTVAISPAVATAGQPLTYTLTITNHGPSEASSIRLTGTLPLSTSLLAAPFGCTGQAGVVTCDLGSLAPGASISAALAVRVHPAARGAMTTTASVAAAFFDPQPDDNAITTTTTITSVADLALGQAVWPGAVHAGQPLTYTLAITNHGPSTALDVILTDTLPAGTIYGASTSGCLPLDHLVICPVPSLAPHAGTVLTVTIRAGSALSDTMTNMATVTAADRDPDAGNNVATATALLRPWLLWLPLIYAH